MKAGFSLHYADIFKTKPHSAKRKKNADTQDPHLKQTNTHTHTNKRSSQHHKHLQNPQMIGSLCM